MCSISFYGPEQQKKSALLWKFSDSLKTLQWLRSWISKEVVDRNYTICFIDQKPEVGVWETLPMLKGTNIWQVSINGKKWQQIWRTVKGSSNSRDALSDTDRELAGSWNTYEYILSWRSCSPTPSLPQNASQAESKLICLVLSPSMKGGRQNHITCKSCSRVKTKVLKQFGRTAYIVLFQNHLKLLFQYHTKQNLLTLPRLSTKLSNFIWTWNSNQIKRMQSSRDLNKRILPDVHWSKLPEVYNAKAQACCYLLSFVSRK